MGQSGGSVAGVRAAAVLGRAGRPGRGGARGACGAPARPAGRPDRPRRAGVGRAALPLVLQLPGRGVQSRGTGRRGGRARPAGAGHHRPRRHVRGAPVRPGGGPAEAAGRPRPGHGVRRGTQPGPARRPGRRPGPGGPAPAGAGPRPRGVPAAVPGHQRRAARRKGEGPPGLPRGRPGAGARRALGDPHRLPQGRGPGRARGRRPGGRRARAPRPGRPVRPRERRHRADRPRPARRRRAQRRPLRAGRRHRNPGDRHRQRALRDAAGRAAGPGAGRGPGPPQPGRDGRLAARIGRRLPAVRRGDGPPAGPVPRRPGAHGRARGGLRVRLPRDRAEAAGLPGAPGLPDRGQLAPPAGHAQGTGTLRPAARRARRGSLRPGRPGARHHRGPRVSRLLPDRARHRGVLRAARHPVPGPRLGRQLGRLLRAGDHQRGPGPARPALRADGTARPTSTWTSSTSAGRRSSSTSTTPTAGTTRPRWPT
jgi:hypothetical protein